MPLSFDCGLERSAGSPGGNSHCRFPSPGPEPQLRWGRMEAPRAAADEHNESCGVRARLGLGGQSQTRTLHWGFCASPRTLQALVHAPVNAQAVLLLLHAPLAAAVVQGFLLESFHGASAFVLRLQARGPAEVALFAGYTLPQCPEFSTTALLLQTLIAGFHAVQAVPSRQPAHFCRQKYIYGEETQTNTRSLREEGGFNPSSREASGKHGAPPHAAHVDNPRSSTLQTSWLHATLQEKAQRVSMGLDPLSGESKQQYFLTLTADL